MRNKWLNRSILSIILLLFPSVCLAVVLKIATIAPEGSNWMKQMRQSASEVKDRTQGRVTIKFYGGGIMGNEKSVLRKMRIGQLHGGAFTSGGLAQVYPDLELYSLPLMFRSLEEIDYVRSHMDPLLIEGLSNAGLISFGFAEGGFAQLMGHIPLRSIEDLKGQKIWIPEGDIPLYKVMKALDLSPVTLPITDVLTGLQTRLIDIVGVSPLGAIAFQWHTRVKYITDTPIAYLFATLVIDQKSFARLQPEDQAVLREVMENVYRDFNIRNRSDNEAASKALISQGIKPIELTPLEQRRIFEHAQPTLQNLYEEGLFTPQLFQQMKNLLKEFREQHHESHHALDRSTQPPP